MKDKEDTHSNFLRIDDGKDAGSLEIDEFQKALFHALLAGWKYVEVEGKFYCPNCSRKYGRRIELDEQPPSILDPTPKPYKCLYCGSENVEVTIGLTLTVRRDSEP